MYMKRAEVGSGENETRRGHVFRVRVVAESHEIFFRAGMIAHFLSFVKMWTAETDGTEPH